MDKKEILKEATKDTLNINEDSPLQKAVLEAMQTYADQQLQLYNVGNCAKLQSEVESRRKQITDINQWTEILLAYRHKIRDRVLWSMIADINNRTTD